MGLLLEALLPVLLSTTCLGTDLHDIVGNLLSQSANADAVAAMAQMKKPTNTTNKIFSMTFKKDLNIKNFDGSFKESCFVEDVKCDKCSIYRSITGWCNNLLRPEQGSAYSLFSRLTGNAYDDKKNSPRSKAKNGQQLKSARKISVTVHETTTVVDNDHSHMVMQWAQFLAHDITFAPGADLSMTPAGPYGAQNDCSKCSSSFPPQNSECFPIKIDSGDPTFDALFQAGRCMPFVRSANGNLNNRKCDSGVREQINQLTSYIDASNVYASEVQKAADLRESNAFGQAGKGYKLKTQANGKLLPPHPDQTGCMPKPNNAAYKCFLAGDLRNTEQIALASIHTLWVKEHNRIATALKSLNFAWDEERVYQEARKIVGALHQRITYEDYLPLLLSQKIRKSYGIVEEQGANYFYGYDQYCDATIMNEFSTAAYRFGHSMVIGQMHVSSPGSVTSLQLRDNFFNPFRLYQSSANIEGILLGEAGQKAGAMDRLIDDALRNRLFEFGKPGNGFDLAALNIQRGRDHGIAPYNAYRRYFMLPKITSWTTASIAFDSTTRSKLQQVYMDVEDIDLWTGIVAEKKSTAGGVLGDIGQHILAEQFRRLKHCDRFFYSNAPSELTPGALTTTQLSAIRNVKLSGVMCSHVTLPVLTAMNSFKVASASNPKKDCKLIPKLTNFNAWKDNKKSPRTCFLTKSCPICQPRCIPEGPSGKDVGVAWVTTSLTCPKL